MSKKFKMDFSKASSSLKGWVDKAKKQADKLKEEFTIQDKKFEFDESYFTLELTGGPKHSDLLRANAMILEGDKAGNSLHLVCKWFKSDGQSEAKEIKGVTGACFQPSIDDVGAKIMVQGTPVHVNGTYTGMPIFKEMGPLIMDYDIEKQALEHLEKEVLELKGRIEEMTYGSGEEADFVLPMPIVFQFVKSKNELLVFTNHPETPKKELFNIDCSDIYPMIELDNMYKNLLVLKFNANDSAKITVESHLDRDVITICLRMFGKGLLDDGTDLLKEMSDKLQQYEENEKLKEQEEKKIQEEEEQRQKDLAEAEAIVKESNNENTDSNEQNKNEEENDQENKAKDENEEKPTTSTEENNDTAKEEQKNPETQESSSQPQSAEKQPQQAPQNRNQGNMEYLMKISALTKENKILKKDLETTSTSLKEKEDQYNKISQQFEEVSIKLKAIQDDYLATKENAEKAAADYERMSNEKTFFLQEITLQKGQIEELENKVASYSTENVAERTRNVSVERRESKLVHEDELKKYQAAVSQLELEVDTLRNEKNKMTRELDLNQTEKENMQSSINSLKNKIKSLVTENEKLAHTSPTHTASVSKISPSQTRSQSQISDQDAKGIQLHKIQDLNDLQDKDTINTLEREIKSLKLQNERLQLTLDSYKVSLDKSPKKGNGFFDKLNFNGNKSNPQQVEQLQKLVNTLTETITDKEQQFDNQKQVNKALANRVTELERMLKALEKVRSQDQNNEDNLRKQSTDTNPHSNTESY